ncbi:MAG: protein kinase [Actinomycetota bacterium]|nr:protein kinase [Actinomycetota bacterium]
MLPDIKNYQIIEEIGRGGMATVYKAWQPSLSRDVALKILPPYFAHDEELLLRFRHEAKAVAKLRHPHIVQVFDLHQEGDWFYLAMEYVAGGSLQQKLARAGRLEPGVALKLIAQVAEGLHHAHEKGFVHRDIKPSNILITEEGQAVITDFGIVKALEGTGFTKTAQGGMGTSEYMSPEQAKGEAVGRRSDLYSLGVVLYEALVGGPPFAGESPLAVMHSQIYDQPAKPSDRNPNISIAVEEIIMKLLAKEPTERFASGLEVVAALTSAAGADLEAPGVGEAGRPAFDRPTLVRRDTRIAKAPEIRAKVLPRPRVEEKIPVEDRPMSGRSRQSASLRRRSPIGLLLLAALILSVSWLAGFVVSYTYIWLPASVAAGVKPPAPPKNRPAGRARPAKAEESTATAPAASTSSPTTAQPAPITPAPNPPITGDPSPGVYAPPLKRRVAPTSPPAPPPDTGPDIPIVIN